MQEMNITAALRKDQSTKGALSQIRAEKNVPGVIYGGHKEPISVTVSMKELEQIVKAGKNTIVEVVMPEGKEMALVKAIQYHVVTDKIIHVDFQRVALTDKMDVVVPLKLTGECADVKIYGAIIEHILRSLEVRAMVSAIPHEIEVDISVMTVNKGIVAGDVKLPAGVELLTDVQAPIVHLMVPKEEVEAAPVAAAGPVAPESSSNKGKKDEEGKLAPKAAAPAKDGAKK